MVYFHYGLHDFLLYLKINQNLFILAPERFSRIGQIGKPYQPKLMRDVILIFEYGENMDKRCDFRGDTP
jgi:hypothetical protein